MTIQVGTRFPDIDDYTVGGAGAPWLFRAASDGSGIASLQVQMKAPDGSTQYLPATLDGEAWSFKPLLADGQTGEYTLRVLAEDGAGNHFVSGVYRFQVYHYLNLTLIFR